jgi:hypothetical protein
MNRNTIVLKDVTEITVVNDDGIHSMQVIVDNLTELGTVWDKLTPTNLSTVTIKDSEGVVVGNYNNMVLCSPAFQSVDKTEDGKISATFGIREKTEIEMLKEQVASMTETLSVHDGAIGDMGAVISAVAEAQEGAIT